MNIRDEGKQLLEEHKQLYNKLIEIPKSRKIVFRMERTNGDIIAKPRFDPEQYEWSPEFFSQLRDHLQNIWNFFETYSYWFDDIMRAVINIKERRISKKSVIYLLEGAIWRTDEVYGDYLVEKTDKNVIISYYRRKQKRRQFQLSPMSDTEIQTWICADARKQVLDRFTFLWTYIENEIDTCIREEFSRLPTTIFTTEYIARQCEKIQKLFPTYPEAALLCLGRTAELWLLQTLDKKNKGYNEDLVVIASSEELINPTQVKLLWKIRREYNLIKHTLSYSINGKLIEELCQKFLILLNEKKNKIGMSN